MKIRFENIFKSAEFRLTIFYFLIICGISLIFNAVIFSTISNGKMEISQDSLQNYVTKSFQQKIIEARNSKAESQILEAMTILNFAILTLGGWGSWRLAKKTLEPLEKAHRLQSEFVSNASHEIRTPLSTIQIETELILSDKNATKNDLKEVLQSNLEEVQSLTALTELLLRLSKIEKLKLEKINLNEIIKSRIAKMGGVEKIKFEESKVFTVHANETAVDELATILIDNALKYNISKERIEVKIFRSNRQAVLEVTNFSQKIEKEELDKMFERFYRADNVRSCNGKCEGHGLGLSIAKKLAENMNADLNVRNEKIPNKNKEQFKTIFRIGLDFEK